MSADILFQRIAAVRRRECRVRALAGAFRVLLALLALMVGFLVLDWLIISRLIEAGGADRMARAVLVTAMAAWLAWLASRDIGRPLIEPLDDDTIALRVEARHPQLRGRLISTVQLARTDPAHIPSPDLVAALEEDTLGVAGALDFAAIVNARVLRRVALLACVFTGLALLLGAWRSDVSQALIARLFLRSSRYPTATRIAAFAVPATVPVGEPLVATLELDATGRVPDEAALVVRPEGGSAARYAFVRDGSAPSGNPRFRCTVEKPLEDLACRAEAGDARWPQWEAVRVLRRPETKAVTIRYRFPAYTGLQPAEVGVADIQALQGTEARIRVAFSKPLTTATIDLAFGDRHEQLPMALEGDGRAGTATLQVTADGTWRLRLRDRDGLENAVASENLIQAVPDQAPTVRIGYPAKDKLVTCSARWPIRFEARDDFSIARAVLKYRIGSVFAEEGQQTESPVRELVIAGLGAPSGLPRAAGEMVLDLGQLRLKPDQRVTWWIEASDNRTPTANTGVSQTFAFTTADDATVAEALNRERDEQVRRIEQLAQQQRESREGVDAIRRDAKPEPRTGATP